MFNRKFCRLSSFLWCSCSGVDPPPSLPQIRLDRILRSAARPGEVAVEIAGKDLDDVKALHFDHPGFKAEPVKDRSSSGRSPPTCRRGVYDVRAVGKYGISAGRFFAVSQGLTEVIEQERANDTAGDRQAVPFNCRHQRFQRQQRRRLFQRSPRTKGQRITIDCQAFRLDLDPARLADPFRPGGKVLARSRPITTGPTRSLMYRSRETALRGRTPRRDLHGRPAVSPDRQRPAPARIRIPDAVAPGETTELTILGRNLPGGRPAPDCVIVACRSIASRPVHRAERPGRGARVRPGQSTTFGKSECAGDAGLAAGTGKPA